MTRLLRIAPELPVGSVADSVEHYEKRLGFQAVMRMPDGHYAIVERDGIAIHLFENGVSERTPVSIHVFTLGLEALFAELQGRGAAVTQPITPKPWGTRDFRVTDPSGNEIKFTEPLRGREQV